MKIFLNIVPTALVTRPQEQSRRIFVKRVSLTFCVLLVSLVLRLGGSARSHPEPSLVHFACVVVVGSYSGSAAALCLTCPAGKSCNNPAVSPVACSGGEYSLGGTVGPSRPTPLLP